MKILVLGSINIDHSYFVKHITTTKETQASSRMERLPGGSGLNRAVALTRAGMDVRMAGMVGSDGVELLEKLQQDGIDTSLVRVLEEDYTGHAVIQVDEVGQNAILLYGGANHRVNEAYIDEMLEGYGKDDVLIIQNQVSCLQYTIDRAYEKGMYIVLNPSPCTQEMMQGDLTKVSLFCMNRTEGRFITSYVQPGDILIHMEEMYPDSEFLLTLGSQGAFFKNKNGQSYQPAQKVSVIDTTSAGDVFESYFLTAYLQGKHPTEALKLATCAAGLAIAHPGAAYFSAPNLEQVHRFMENPKGCADI
ncbi:MAG: ribokinase [Eubacteriales bacterium]|nr:ribokinase [Eubacteriales bacterium]